MYELDILISPILELEDAELRAEKIKQQIESLNGQIKKIHNLGKIKLAYPIKKQLLAYFFCLEFEIDSEEIEKLQNNLKFENDILRFLLLSKSQKEKEKEESLVKPQGVKSIATPKTPSVAPEETIKTEKAAKIKIEELDKKLEELLN